MSYENLAPKAAAAAIDAEADLVVLDVRSEPEYQNYHIDGAVLIPVDQVEARAVELDSSKHHLVLCEHGMRSVMACEILTALGFARLTNMTGGMAEWMADGLGHVSG